MCEWETGNIFDVFLLADNVHERGIFDDIEMKTSAYLDTPSDWISNMDQTQFE